MAESAMLSKTAVPSKATLHQTLSLMFVYSRLPGLALFPPLTPLCIPLVFALLNLATFGHAAFTILTSLSFYTLGIVLIYQYSNTVQEREKALKKNEIQLPIEAVVLSALFQGLVKYVAGDLLSWYPSTLDAFAIFGRIAIAAVLLESAVFWRYFGPFSISK